MLPSQNSLWTRDGTRRQFFVYILSNPSMTMYTGITRNLVDRFEQHMRGETEFTSRYHFDRIVYYEIYDLVVDAVTREKQIKGLGRKRKIALVKAVNPAWRNLMEPESHVV